MGVNVNTPLLSKSVNAFELYRGQSKTMPVVATTPGTDVDGNPIKVPIDLTGATITMQVRQNLDDPNFLFQKISTDPTQITIVSPATGGNANIFFKPDDTRYLDPGTYFFDVWVLTAAGDNFPLIEVSELVLLQPVTRKI